MYGVVCDGFHDYQGKAAGNDIALKFFDLPWKHKFTTEPDIFHGQSSFQSYLNNRPYKKRNFVGREKLIVRISMFKLRQTK